MNPNFAAQQERVLRSLLAAIEWNSYACMTLFEAKPFDPAHARQRRFRIIATIVVAIVNAAASLALHYWREERQVDKVFDALQTQSYEQAYGVWMNDPDWKQHPDKYARYPFSDFMKDWGPGGEWGIIKSHSIDGREPKGGDAGASSPQAAS